jgi:Holliday junction resolvase
VVGFFFRAAAISNFGHNRERQLVQLLREDDWFAMRAPASLGVADVVALKDGKRPRLIECKATAAGPYSGFSPADRAELEFAAQTAGAEAWLVWWPKRAKPTWIPSHEFPRRKYTK